MWSSWTHYFIKHTIISSIYPALPFITFCQKYKTSASCFQARPSTCQKTSITPQHMLKILSKPSLRSLPAIKTASSQFLSSSFTNKISSYSSAVILSVHPSLERLQRQDHQYTHCNKENRDCCIRSHKSSWEKSPSSRLVASMKYRTISCTFPTFTYMHSYDNCLNQSLTQVPMTLTTRFLGLMFDSLPPLSICRRRFACQDIFPSSQSH